MAPNLKIASMEQMASIDGSQSKPIVDPGSTIDSSLDAIEELFLITAS